MTENTKEIPEEYKFNFVTTDLTFDQCEVFSKHWAKLREAQRRNDASFLWEAWGLYYPIAQERLVDKTDLARLAKVPFKYLPVVAYQLQNAVIGAMNLRALEKQLDGSDEKKEDG